MNASRCDDTRPTGAGRPWRVAILPWGNLIEDFLDPPGLSREDSARNMSGGWLFGYAAALRSAGMEPVILCVSGRVRRTERLVHPETGVVTLALPASAIYLALRRFPGDPDAGAALRGPIGRRLQAAVPYLATPPAARRPAGRASVGRHHLPSLPGIRI
jgi:starch synthase